MCLRHVELRMNIIPNASATNIVSFSAIDSRLDESAEGTAVVYAMIIIIIQ